MLIAEQTMTPEPYLHMSLNISLAMLVIIFYIVIESIVKKCVVVLTSYDAMCIIWG